MIDMKYVKIFTDFVKALKPLSYTERGRLFTAMLEYAETGVETELCGNERFLWEIAKINIDTQRAAYEKMCDVNAQNQAKRGKTTNRNEPLRTVTNRNESLQDKDKDKEKKRKEKESIARFAPPSLDDVRDYCQSRKNSVDAASFVDFYTAKGWKVGNQPMKDWQAAVRTWERRGSSQTSGAGPPVSRALRPPQRKYTADDLKHIGVDLMEDVYD